MLKRGVISNKWDLTGMKRDVGLESDISIWIHDCVYVCVCIHK